MLHHSPWGYWTGRRIDIDGARGAFLTRRQRGGAIEAPGARGHACLSHQVRSTRPPAAELVRWHVVAAPRNPEQRDRKAVLDELEESIENLKVAYERYFWGVDKVPPRKQHEAVDRLMREQLSATVMNTALRFRIGSLKSRYVTYGQYWTRITNQIEKGTFKRVVEEAHRRDRVGTMASRASGSELGGADVDQLESGTEQESLKSSQVAANAKPAMNGAGPPRPPSGPSAAATGAPPALPPGMDAKEVRDLFKNYINAKKAAGESVTGVSYGALVDKLSREIPALEQRHGGKVRLEVATVDGHVRLKARRVTP